MGLLANVYRSGRLLPAKKTMSFDDCTIDGWSVNFDRVCVVNADGPFEPDEHHPAVLVVRHHLPQYNCLHVVSVAHRNAGKHTMMGGNFLSTSDSRFGELCVRLMSEGKHGIQTHAVHWSPGAIPIHDRVE